MKKSMLVFLSAAMMLSVSACGSKTTETETPQTQTAAETDAADETADETADAEETDAEETEAAGPYAFAGGVYSNSSFSITVPEGFCLDESYCDEEGAKFLQADSKDDFDVFNQASLEIEITDYAYDSRDSEYGLASLVENDQQFFKEDAPVISDASLDLYDGSMLEGASSFYANITYTYYDLENWDGDTNNRSVMKIRMAYQDEETKAILQEMLNSMEILLQPAEAAGSAGAASETDGETITMAALTITTAGGWYAEKASDTEAVFVNDAYDSASITIACKSRSYSSSAAEAAESISGNFGGGHEVNAYDLGGYEFVGINPVDNQYYVFADNSDETYQIKISTMRVTLDQAADLFAGMEIN